MDPRDKAIFRFWNGDRWCWADPLPLQRALDLGLGDSDAVFRDIKDPDPAVWRPALECLIVNVRETFAMPAIDPDSGAGATEEDCRHALEALRAFLEKKNPPTEPPPSSSPPSVLPLPDSSSTMPPTSACA